MVSPKGWVGGKKKTLFSQSNKSPMLHFFARAVRAYMRALAPSQKKEASAGGVI